MRQNLFNKLRELGIIALESEMQDIERAIEKDKEEQEILDQKEKAVNTKQI